MRDKRFQCEVEDCKYYAESFCTNCGFRMCPNDHGWKVEKEEDACPKCPIDSWNNGWWNSAARHKRWYQEDN